MLYNNLGNTELQVSRICLGTMTWGEQNSEQQAHQQLDFALEQGINFIDTAELYAVPPRAETQGLTETYIGNWLQQRRLRDKIILASKVAGPGEWVSYLRAGPQLNRSHITQALEASLQRLRTDYIDLYQIHWPARNCNFFGQLGYQYQPNENSEQVNAVILEILTTLAELVQAGKIRYIGVSNETAWGVMNYLHLAKVHNYPLIATVQNPYNLLNRSYEIGLAEISHREGVGLLSYSPLAFGVLSGKYLDGARPAGARLTLFDRFFRYNNEQAEKATAAYVKLARDSHLSPAQMALAYVNSRPFLSSNIIGATNLTQLAENIASIDLELSPATLEAIEAIHTQYSNPSP
jgi:aryl-alcohol dehydrogenase-like predicted oxidoreductase